MILDTLTRTCIVHFYIPDISLEEARKNEPYVLKIVTPAWAQFLGVTQISSPLAGLGALSGAPQISYAFLCEHADPPTANVYITAVFSERPFPWHGPTMQRREATCTPLGITTHSGVPLLHVQVNVAKDDYDIFEKELEEYGYRIVPSKIYNASESLIELYKQGAVKGALT